MLKKKLKRILPKKIPIFIAFLLFIIIIGWTLATPPIQNALVRTQFLNPIFPAKTTIVNSIHEELIKSNFHINNVELHPSDKIITITVNGTKEYVNSVQSDIEKEVNDLLNAMNINAYSLEITYKSEPSVKGASAKNEKQAKALEKAIMTDPRLQKYELISAFVSMNDVENSIPLILSENEKHLGDIIQVVNNIVSEHNMGPFAIKPLYIDAKNEQIAEKWQPIINTIHTGLVINKEYKVVDVYYSFEEPYTISVITNHSATDSNTVKIAKKIEQSITEFLVSDEISKIIQGDEYNIVVYGRDNIVIDTANPQLEDFKWH